MYELDFTINELPKIITNGSQSNWRARAAIRKAWKLKTQQAITHYPNAPLVLAECTFVRASSMEPDDDNLRASFKSVRDALVTYGVLVDDKPSNMPNPKYVWERVKPKNGFIRVIVREIIKDGSNETKDSKAG